MLTKDIRKLNQQEKFNFVDSEIQRSYWYYLRNSTKVFQIGVDVSDVEGRYFIIYRNVVGTFLTVSDLKNNHIEITSFVKLGAGSSSSPTQTQLSLQPFIISLKLSPTEVLLEVNDQGQIFVNGVNIANQQEIREANARLIDAFLRKHYWFYLSKSIITHSDHIETSERDYHVLIYSGISGSYFVIASVEGGNVQVNTLVRLGDQENNNGVELNPQLIAFS